MRYNDESEIAEVVRKFEDATYDREAWGHAEHLTVGLYLVTKHDLETAINMIRVGLFKLLRAYGVDLTKEMPYHETLTVFWMRTIADFNASKNESSLLDKANELIISFDKNYPNRFYSREYLFSDKARESFVDGDLELTRFQNKRTIAD
ncbi:MAG: hypothetical protein WBO10_12380 [Pyrinomonadaceae bacterium]